MVPVLRSKLGRKFVITFFLLALPLFLAGWLALRYATSALVLQTHQTLRSASDGAEAQLREVLGLYKRATLTLSRSPEILESFSARSAGPVNLAPILSHLTAEVPQALKVICINTNGKVVASSGPITSQDRSDLASYRFRDSFDFGDVTRTFGDTLRWRLSAPVKDPHTGALLGVVILGINPQVLSDLTTGKRALDLGADTQSLRIGDTGETYLVNRQGFMITQSRSFTNSILSIKVDSEPIRLAAARGQEMIGDYTDYRGVRVSGASAIIRETGWVLLTEIDFSQVLAPLNMMRREFLIVFIGVAIVGAFIGMQVARNLIYPLQVVSEADQALTTGNEVAAFPSEKNFPNNEIREFVRNRNRRIKILIRRHRELLREQKARAQAATELERISYSIVHDMRAPLRAITSFAELVEIEDGDQLNDQQRGYLERIRRASTRMDKLIFDMLRYSSMLRQEIPVRPIKIRPLLDEVINDNPNLRTHKTDIEIADDIPMVIGNETALIEVFTALLDNAIRYTPSERRPFVRITGKLNRSRVRISVQDHGVGIPPTFQLKVFDIYARGTSTGEGTGIGLALVRVAIERMGGRVGVESVESEGSVFWFELKAAGVDQNEAPEESLHSSEILSALADN